MLDILEKSSMTNLLAYDHIVNLMVEKVFKTDQDITDEKFLRKLTSVQMKDNIIQLNNFLQTELLN